ncbi:MAG TPA: ABC transporter ATP-binding protein [Caulobacteraceae bacterium]
MSSRPASSVIRSAGAFAADFARFAGSQGLLAVALVLCGVIVEGAGVVLLIPILGLVVGNAGGAGAVALKALDAAGVHGRSSQLIALLGAFLVLMTVRAAALFARDVLLFQLQARFVATRRAEVFAAVAQASWAHVSGLRHAQLINLLSAEFQRMAAATQFMLQGSVAAVLLVAQSALAFALSPLLTLVVAAFVLVPLVVLSKARGARAAGLDVGRASIVLTGQVTTFLQGLKSAIAQDTQGRFLEQFGQVQGELVGRQQGFVRGQAAMRLGLSLITALAAAVSVGVAVLVLSLPSAVLITLVLVFSRMAGPAMSVQQSVQQFMFSLPAFEAVRELKVDLGGARETRGEAEPPPGPVVFEGVAYSHPGGGGAEDLSFELAPGEFLGVSGPSGAGKTTLLDLLAGLLQPASGRIVVGGQLLGAANLAGWRKHIAYVTQDPFLFHASVRANIEAGARPASDAEIWRALELVGAGDLVRGLPQGLETQVGERGARLSGGERQRLSLAAALLRRPRLLILDEATNALDLAAEAQILQRLAAMESRPSIVMVSHRPESLRWCDRVLPLAPVP